jgi:uncharacterized protein involved in response to NO
MQTEASTQITNTTMSKTERRVLGLDLHEWESVMVWGLGVAAIAAVVVVVATRVVVLLQRESLQEDEARIAEAAEGAAKANARASEANERAATAGKAATEASAKAEGFRLDIAKANERAVGRCPDAC